MRPNNSVDVSVVIPTHNPDPERLRRTLEGLQSQTLPPDRWECLLVDNRSDQSVVKTDGNDSRLTNLRIIREETLGLTAARKRGFREGRAEIFVLVDDDNVLESAYLESVLRIFGADNNLGAIGGKSIPEFAAPPGDWIAEFYGLLALRDLGALPLTFPENTGKKLIRDYPECAPIGAGMGIRREAIQNWLDRAEGSSLSDRRGQALSSAGDCDIVMTVLEHGWSVGYVPELCLTHLIPEGRTQPNYLARLNRGIQKSWVEVLNFHGIRPWPAIPRWSLPLRKAKAYLAARAWHDPAAWIRWSGVAGRLEGCSCLAPRTDFTATSETTGSSNFGAYRDDQ